MTIGWGLSMTNRDQKEKSPRTVVVGFLVFVSVMLGSNQRPPDQKSAALPSELTTEGRHHGGSAVFC